MNESERKEVFKEISRLEEMLKKEGVQNKVKTPEEYIAEMKLYGDAPKDQFAHQFKLLYHKQTEPKTQMDLLPPDALLGLVKDSKSMLFLQNDNALLNRFFDMGLRDEGVMELFNSLYYSWWQQVRMTGIMGGTERWLQSFLEPNHVPYEGFTFMEKRQAKKKSQQFDFGAIADRISTNQKNRTYI